MKYKHFKGNEYYYICDAKHAETNEPMAVYKDIKGNVFVRSFERFYGYVEMPAPDGFAMVRRFKEMRCVVCGEFLDECRAGHSQK